MGTISPASCGDAKATCSYEMDPSTTLTTTDSVLGGGWSLVRRVNAGNAWHQATDNCKGTDVYGTASSNSKSASSFSINFEDAVPQYNEMLFTTGDLTKWLVAPRVEVEALRYNQPAVVLSSSENSETSTPKWNNRRQAGSPVTGMWFDLHADKQTGNTPVDSVSSMVFYDKTVETGPDGVKYWDLQRSHMQRRSGPVIVEGQYYTHAYVLKWRQTNSGWRTLLRHDADHCGIVRSGQTKAGMYANRGGGFRDTGFDIKPQQTRWEVVVITGAGDTATSHTGVTTWCVSHTTLKQFMPNTVLWVHRIPFLCFPRLPCFELTKLCHSHFPMSFIGTRKTPQLL